jgi:hypothetical protein
MKTAAAAPLRVIAGKPASRAAEKRLKLREELWPSAEPKLWHRTKENGWSTIPRTLSLLMTLIDLLKPGMNVSRVYLELWCRQLDDSFVVIDDEEGLAYSCGYMTAHNVRRLRERLGILKQLGFIDIQPNGRREYGYVLLLHPHKVARDIVNGSSRLDIKRWKGAWLGRASEIGCELPK